MNIKIANKNTSHILHHTSNYKGITLIALVITIIVMLILVAVTISISINGGLFSYAGKAAKETSIGREKEQVGIAYSAAFMRNPLGKVKAKDLQEELDSVVGQDKTTVSGGNTLKIKFIDSQREYTISVDGTVEEYELPEVTDVYVAVCSNGVMVFSNNEADINSYLTQNGTSIAQGYEITNIKDSKFYYHPNHDVNEDENEEYDSVLWEWDRNIEHALFLNKVVPKSTAFWFPYLPNLVSIDNIYNLDTSNVTNMRGMFYACNSLETVDFSNFNTSNVTDMSYMFGCYNDEDLPPGFTSLDLSSFDTSNVVAMEGMFNICGSLEEVDLSSFDTRNVKTMRNMFFYCCGLNSLDLSSFDTSNVEDMNTMFAQCRNLDRFNLSSFNTSNVTDMGYMFWYCSANNLSFLDSFDTSNVENMAGMFMDFNGIQEFDLTNFDTSNVIGMHSMFRYANIRTLDLSSFDTSKVTDMSYMFYNCYPLETIYASDSFVTDNVTSSNYMFNSCPKLRGGRGTFVMNNPYTETVTNKSYARIDLEGAPGLFTAKPATP